MKKCFKKKQKPAASPSHLSTIDENMPELQFAPPANGLLTPPYHHQVPPYGKQGNPYIVTKQDVLYPYPAPGKVLPGESSSNGAHFRIDWSLLQKKRLTEQLRNCFPFVYVITHCCALILNSICQFAFQVALMATNGALW